MEYFPNWNPRACNLSFHPSTLNNFTWSNIYFLFFIITPSSEATGVQISTIEVADCQSNRIHRGWEFLTWRRPSRWPTHAQTWAQVVGLNMQIKCTQYTHTNTKTDWCWYASLLELDSDMNLLECVREPSPSLAEWHLSNQVFFCIQWAPAGTEVHVAVVLFQVHSFTVLF